MTVERSLAVAFRMYDRDGDGLISREDLALTLRLLVQLPGEGTERVDEVLRECLWSSMRLFIHLSACMRAGGACGCAAHHA